MAAPHHGLATLSSQDRLDLEARLVEFDQKWTEGRLHADAARIPASSSWRLPGLAEMVKIDLERRWRQGDRVSLESYLAQFPELGNPANVSADLIQADYEVRRQFGAAAGLDDYARRFPLRIDELRRLVAETETGTRSRLRENTRRPASGEPPWKPPRDFPERIGRYRIVERLGKGGMGSVYLADDTELGRRVALKLSDMGGSAEGMKRFEREARALAALDHPLICPVHDYGVFEGNPFLVMPYFGGESLAQSIPAGGFPPRQAAAIVGKLAVAMQEAHEHGILHRDLKPSNVMMKPKGERREPVIVDFGLARRDDASDEALTSTGQALGTIHYMPLEQIEGTLDAIGPACDIYALGVILYELMTGGRPFEGPYPAIVAQKLTHGTVPPSTLRPDIDLRLEAICLKAMAKEANDRHPTMKALAAELTELLKKPESSAEREPEPLTAPSQGDQRRKLMIALASTFGAILLGVVIYVRTDKASIEVEIPDSKTSTHVTVVEADGNPILDVKTKPVPSVPSALPPSPPGISPDAQPTAWKSITNTIGMKLVLIPAGDFLMGSPDTDTDASENEKPQHRVRITRPFYLGATEVTVGQFRKIIESSGYRTEAERDGVGGWGWDAAVGKFGPYPKLNWRNPGIVQTDEHPVVEVSWNDAVAVCNELSKLERLKPYYDADGTVLGGDGYRLPTEAEWEYACRAGSEASHSFGDDRSLVSSHAWTADNSGRGVWDSAKIWQESGADYQKFVAESMRHGCGTHPVGQKPVNQFGLHDMHGNVQEWCWDAYERGYDRQSPRSDPAGPLQAANRVNRGTCWNNLPPGVRPAKRTGYPQGGRDIFVGFRVARGQSASAPSLAQEPSAPKPAVGRSVGPETTPNVSGSFPDAPATARKSIINTIGMKLVLIPAGDFLMGSPDMDTDAHENEKPRHRVRITRSFYLGATEVTVGQFRKIIQWSGYRTEAERDGKGGLGWDQAKRKVTQNPKHTWRNPGFAQTDEHPVVEVTWNDAIAVCNQLSKLEGLKPYYRGDATVSDGYRLPTEAEWEYACRSRSDAKYSFGDDLSLLPSYGWTADNSGHGSWDAYQFWNDSGKNLLKYHAAVMHRGCRSHPVGQKQPNAFGLFDMHGNVWEWCWDGLDKDYYRVSPGSDPSGPLQTSIRVIRGGSWALSPRFARSASRGRGTPDRDHALGFRVARVQSDR